MEAPVRGGDMKSVSREICDNPSADNVLLLPIGAVVEIIASAARGGRFRAARAEEACAAIDGWTSAHVRRGDVTLAVVRLASALYAPPAAVEADQPAGVEDHEPIPTESARYSHDDLVKHVELILQAQREATAAALAPMKAAIESMAAVVKIQGDTARDLVTSYRALSRDAADVARRSGLQEAAEVVAGDEGVVGGIVERLVPLVIPLLQSVLAAPGKAV